MLAGAFLVWVSAGELCFCSTTCRYGSGIGGRAIGCLAMRSPRLPMIWPRFALRIELVARVLCLCRHRHDVVRGRFGIIASRATHDGDRRQFARVFTSDFGQLVFQIRWLGDPGGDRACRAPIFTTKGCDIGAFFAGRVFGSPTVAPNLSPAKTVERHWRIGRGDADCGRCRPARARQQVALVLAGALVFGLAVGLSQLGDLLESLLKRDVSERRGDQHPRFGGLLAVTC